MSGVQRWNSDHSSEEDEGKEVARRVSARLFKLAEKCQVSTLILLHDQIS